MNIRELDQFFTKKETVNICLQTLAKHIDINNVDWIEPSAGSGAFIDGAVEFGMGLPKIAFDIMPQHYLVIESNFLETDVESLFLENEKIKLFLGNPPFGKNSSLAIKFFNHMAKSKVDFIAMVLPATFSKNSIKNKLNFNYILIEDLDLGVSEFDFGKEIRKVPVVFQVWKKSEIKREKIVEKTISSLFDFVSKEEAEFAIQRVGVAAGKVKLNFRNVSPSSHYFIKENVKGVLDLFLKIDWTEIKNKTAGNPSIAKTELIRILEKEYNKI